MSSTLVARRPSEDPCELGACEPGGLSCLGAAWMGGLCAAMFLNKLGACVLCVSAGLETAVLLYDRCSAVLRMTQSDCQGVGRVIIAWCIIKLVKGRCTYKFKLSARGCSLVDLLRSSV